MSDSGQPRHASETRTAETAWREVEYQVKLVSALLDLCWPGSKLRGERVAELAGRMGTRFEMPSRFFRELKMIGRTYDAGRLISSINGGEETSEDQPWQDALNLRALLRHVPGCESAADVAGSIYENWDGTGFPAHLMQGQIPLRSRILRVVLDFVRAVEAGDQAVDDILAAMAEHSGTRYDPIAIVHLLQIELPDISAARREGSILVVPVSGLQAGMILAQDLYTDSGLKLISRGTILDQANLSAVLRRHKFDPIIGGVRVRRIEG